MTLPRKERDENFLLALGLMLDAVGDSELDEVLFAPSTHSSILSTTWEELLVHQLVEKLPSGDYVLTGRCWTAGVIETGRRNAPAFQARVGILFRALKGFVKGRAEKAVVPFREVVSKTGLPPGFVYNVIEGRYREEVYNQRGASWVKPGRLVLVPVTFEHEPTDLSTLLSPVMIHEVEALTEELDTTRSRLGDYLCPHCGSKLVASGSYPVDEHTDGDYEHFSCGYGLRDGQVEGLCPLDPNFPRFEDFELQMHQQESGEWICWPVAKTRHARLLPLCASPGGTEAEAQSRVKALYMSYAGAVDGPRDLSSRKGFSRT